MKKHIPNFLTSLNVFCGTLSVFFALNGHLKTSAILIFIAALFDFSDGFAARMLKAYSDIGKELDSLADLISFGMAPAAILSSIMMGLYGVASMNEFIELDTLSKFAILFPFLLVVFAALRLAKFNIDTRQSENFLGLTTTATGIFTASFVFLIAKGLSWTQWLVSPLSLIILIAIFCGLLVSEIPMFSLKFKNYSFKNNLNRYILLIAGLALIVSLGMAGISILIVLYIVFSLFTSLVCKSNNGK